MKKRLFILLFMFLFVVSIDKVLADGIFTIKYEKCSKAVDSTFDIEKETTPAVICTKADHDAKKCNYTPTEKCSDDGYGWYVSVKSKKDGKDYYYCVDDSFKENCGDQGYKIYKNGVSVGETGDDGDIVTFTWVAKDDNSQTFTAHFDSGATDATGSMGDQTIHIGAKEKLKKNEFKRENYKFNGWIAQAVIDGKKLYICSDGSYKEKIGDCTDFSGIRIYSDQAVVNQTGVVGGNVYFTATWKVFMKGNPACRQYNSENACTSAGCSWNSRHSFCNNTGLTYLKCGDATDIPEIVPELTGYAVTLLKTVAPIVLIIMSIIQLVKSITAAKDDEIKKAQATLVKRLIIAALIFLVITIVQFVLLKVADSSEKGNLSSCLSCFLNGSSDSKCGSVYYNDGDGKCYYTGSGTQFKCDI